MINIALFGTSEIFETLIGSVFDSVAVNFFSCVAVSEKNPCKYHFQAGTWIRHCMAIERCDPGADSKAHSLPQMERMVGSSLTRDLRNRKLPRKEFAGAVAKIRFGIDHFD